MREAFELGEFLGTEKVKNDVVLSMYEEKIDLNLISKITKLSIDEIKEIINNKK